MNPLKIVKVFIVEDERVMAESICHQLESQSGGQLVCAGIETDGVRAVEKTQEIKPDVILIDLDLPRSKINGLVVGKKVCVSLPDCKVIALTKIRAYQPVRQALKMGFKGYLLKEDSMDEIISAIKYVAVGGVSISPGVSTYLSFDERYEAVTSLTSRELEVAKLVKDGSSNQEIADKLSIGIETAKHHVSEILQKLGLKNRAHLASYVTELERSGLWSLLLETDDK